MSCERTWQEPPNHKVYSVFEKANAESMSLLKVAKLHVCLLTRAGRAAPELIGRTKDTTGQRWQRDIGTTVPVECLQLPMIILNMDVMRVSTPTWLDV